MCVGVGVCGCGCERESEREREREREREDVSLFVKIMFEKQCDHILCEGLFSIRLNIEDNLANI